MAEQAKKLSWQGPIAGFGIGDMYQAQVWRSFGYRLSDHLTGRARWKLTVGSKQIGAFSTLEKGKKAAQDDLNMAIQSILSGPPAERTDEGQP